MSFKDKVKIWVKTPYFWLVIGMIALAIIISIMLSTPPPEKPKCPAGTERGTCGDQCVPICPDGSKYDCASKECSCTGNQTMCNGECCPANACINGLCCTKNRQCPVGPGGKMQCCTDGQVCDSTGKKCVSTCAVNGKECKENETCLTVGPINQELQYKFKNDFPVSTYPSALCVDGICSVCVPNSKCQFDLDQTSPIPLKEGTSTYYPCTNIINGADKNGVMGYCSSDTPGDARACNQKFSSDEKCVGTCVWRNVFDSTVTHEVINKDIANIGSSDPKVSYEGNWCGNPGKYLHVDKLSQKSGSTCDTTTCWSSLKNHPNIIDIHWDGTTCTSVSSCDTGNPVGFSSPCDQKAKPPICSREYECASSGEITKPVPTACSSYPTCDAVTSSGNPNIGWCVTQTSPGVYKQSCTLSESACNTQKDSEFITKKERCPYNPKVPNVGCGPNYSLTKDATGNFACNLVDTQTALKDIALSGTGLCGSDSSDSSIRTYVENRTKYTIHFYGVDGDGNCSHGKMCGPGGNSIAPFTGTYWNAGTRSGSSVDPGPCWITANIPELGTDTYIINIDSKYLSSCPSGSNYMNITNPAPTSKLAQEVKVMAKFYCYDSSPTFVNGSRIVFYPGWEIAPADAVISN